MMEAKGATPLVMYYEMLMQGLAATGQGPASRGGARTLAAMGLPATLGGVGRQRQTSTMSIRRCTR